MGMLNIKQSIAQMFGPSRGKMTGGFYLLKGGRVGVGVGATVLMS